MGYIGQPPKPEADKKSKMLKFRVKPHIFKAVKILAKRERVTVTKILERALFAYLAGSTNAAIAEAEARQIEGFNSGEIG